MPRDNSPVVLLDFDGTMVEHEFPETGDDIGAVPWLKQGLDRGARYVLNTMRDGDHLANAVKWFEDNDIPLYGINRNPDQGWTTSPKVYGYLSIDDINMGIPLTRRAGKRRWHVDWSVAGPQLIKWLDMWNSGNRKP